MFHIIEISENSPQLSIDNGRLALSLHEQRFFYSLQEIDALILANSGLSLTGCLLGELAKHKVPVVICERSYKPTGILLPLGSESAEENNALHAQIQMPVPLKKQLWQAIIRQKILNQAVILEHYRHHQALKPLSKLIRSGDPDNIEAQAAGVYWKTLDIFPKRDRNADDANRLLNYAYTILYAATARYVCASCLMPHIGLKHHNQYNPFCLASDLMEPFRAYADAAVLNLLQSNGDDSTLSQHNRQVIVETIYGTKVAIANEQTDLFHAIQQTVWSYKHCLYQKNSKMLVLPQMAA